MPITDMKVDQLARTQIAVGQQLGAMRLEGATGATASVGLYSGLGLEEFLDYGGLNISEAAIVQAMPGDLGQQVLAYQQQFTKPVAAITPVQDKHITRAGIKQGVREVVLAKDQSGKLGVAVQHIDKGVFVSFVWKDSAAALAGLRFGDQILQINGETVAGWDNSKTLKFLKKADGQAVTFAVRDRPFARVVTVVKDHQNQIGFLFKKGAVTAIVKDSSAARNGLLIHHNLMEVNGQNVIGLKDEEILRIMKEADRSVSLTIMPSFVYDHLIKHIGYSQLKKYMDHSIPEF